MPLAHPSTLDHLVRTLERGLAGVSWRGLEPGARQGSPGAFSLGRAAIASLDFFQLGITGWDRFRHKKGDHLVALVMIRSASRSHRAGLPTRAGVGATPHTRSQSCRRGAIGRGCLRRSSSSWSGKLGKPPDAVKGSAASRGATSHQVAGADAFHDRGGSTVTKSSSGRVDSEGRMPRPQSVSEASVSGTKSVTNPRWHHGRRRS
jgi:hypothetical protein